MDICTHEQTGTFLHFMNAHCSLEWSSAVAVSGSLRHSSDRPNAWSEFLQLSCNAAEMCHVWATCLYLSCLLDSIKSSRWRKNWPFYPTENNQAANKSDSQDCQIKFRLRLHSLIVLTIPGQRSRIAQCPRSWGRTAQTCCVKYWSGTHSQAVNRPAEPSGRTSTSFAGSGDHLCRSVGEKVQRIWQDTLITECYSSHKQYILERLRGKKTGYLHPVKHYGLC